MQLNKAKIEGEHIRGQLTPFCKDNRCEIVGSVRRGKPEVHDLDFVCIPISQAFYSMLNRLGKVSGGPKIYKVELPIRDGAKPFTADIYIVTEATWATLLLIRTGSADHNRRLCALAKSKGMKLHADGTGLARIHKRVLGLFGDEIETAEDEEFIPCATETDIFKALGLPYKAPGDRV